MTTLAQVGRTLGITSLTIGAAAGLVGVGALAAVRRSLPRTSGTLPLPCLHEPVTVQRDRWGVPHIYAANNHDLFAALGYVHAQDRLWQMELNRSMGNGQLAAIFGELVLPTDRFVRVLGLGRQARSEVERMADEPRSLVESYVQGINTFVETNENRLSPEFSLLRHQPRPWDAADVVVWSKVIAHALSGNWSIELLNARILALVGPERARELKLHYPDDQPVMIPTGSRYAPRTGEALLNGSDHLPPELNGRLPGQGSNAWVVGGSRTTSGKPLLANDPHLGVSMPSIWYEAHLEGGDFRVTGATFPGLPAVVIGHNEHIAWGITNTMIDVQDLYIERFDPNDPLRYQWRDGWETAQLVREEIQVKGRSEPVIEEVRITRHGPVVGPVVAPPGTPFYEAYGPPAPPAEHENGQNGHSVEELAQLAQQAEPAPPADQPLETLAIRWTGHETGDLVAAAIDYNRAQDWHAFRSALRIWKAPPQNFLYADTAGNHGYMLAGALPLRAQGDGQLPVPGWTGDYEWEGFIPHDELPAVLNPESGMVINANQRLVGEDYPYYEHVRGEWMSGYRAMRIQALLEATPQHDIDSFAAMQQDLYSIPGTELAQLVADLPLSDPFEMQARDLLVGWDGIMSVDSVGATIYTVLRYHLERQAYAEVGDLLYAPAHNGFFQTLPINETLNRRGLNAILHRIRAAAGPELADPWLGPDRTWTDLLYEGLRLTVNELKQQFGKNPQQWRYGRLHTLTMHHTLGRVALLSQLFNRGPWPTGGDLDTVCMGYTPRDAVAGAIYVGPLYRQICDPSDWEASVSVLLSGQSGHPASRHYCDMHALWQQGDYHPMLWSRERVDEHTIATLSLEPA
jgi:penicillin amidase